MKTAECLSLVIATLGFTTFGSAVTLDSVGDYKTMTTGSYWSNGVAPTDAGASGQDYYILNKFNVQVPWYNSYTFYCNSMTWGDSGTQIAMIKRKTTMTFMNEGLKIVNIRMDDWDDSALTIAGPVSFSGNKISSFYGARANANHYTFTGKVSADSESGFALYRSTAENDKYYGMTFTGDLTDFRGKMQLGDCARLELAANTMAGSIEFNGTENCRSVLAHRAGSTGLTIGGFSTTSTSGAAIEFTANCELGSCQSLVVTDYCQIAGSVEMRMLSEVDTTGTKAAKYKVFQAPAGTTLSASMFTFVPPAGANSADYALQVEGNVLYVQHLRQVTISRIGEYLDSSESWSDGEAPHEDADYLSSTDNPKQMRTPSQTTSPWVFAGKSLVVNSVGQNMVLQAWDQTINNLTLYTELQMDNWHPADKSLNAFSANGTRRLGGSIVLNGGNLKLVTNLDIYLQVNATISGESQLQVVPAGTVDSKDGTFFVEFAGDNRAFTGILNVYSATAMTKGTVILFRNANNLGGNPASYKYNAINIASERITFRPLETTVLENMNRGFDIFYPVTFDTPEGVTLTEKQILRHRNAKADIIKKGLGKLILADVPVFLEADRPSIRIEEGSFEAGTLEACEGCSVVFGGKAKLSVPDPNLAGTGIATYGLKNTTAGTPIIVLSDDGKLHVDASAVPQGFVVPFLTVSSEEAAKLRNKIVIDKPGTGLMGIVLEKTVDVGTVTFCVKVCHQGLLVVFR